MSVMNCYILNTTAIPVADMDVRWRQLKALTWKNYRAQRKKPATLCCQIFGPTLFSALVLLLHSSTKWIVVPDSESWMQDSISICTNFGDRQTIYCVGKNKRLYMYYSPDVQVAKTLMTHINDGLANRLSECFGQFYSYQTSLSQ